MIGNNKQYLGDGVYVEDQGFMVRLTSENGISVLSEIYLEPNVWDALKNYMENRDEHI